MHGPALRGSRIVRCARARASRHSTSALSGMNFLWRALKLLLSTALLLAAGTFFWLLFTREFQPVVLVIASVLVFFAAWPWVNHERPSRVLALVGCVFALAFAFVAARTASGEVVFPRHCSGRGSLYCAMENLLYAIGGTGLAALPFAVLSVAVLALSLRALARLRVHSRY